MKLRLSYFGHIMGRQDSMAKTIMLGKVEDSRKRGRPNNIRWTDSLKEAIGLSLQTGLLRTGHFGDGSFIRSP